MKLDEILIEEAEYQEAWKCDMRGRACLFTERYEKEEGRQVKDNVQSDRKKRNPQKSHPTAEGMFLFFGKKNLSLSTSQRVTAVPLSSVLWQACHHMPFHRKPILVHPFCCFFAQK